MAVTIAYTFGWRIKSEVLTLERRHLDLKAGTLRLDPGMAKRGDVVYLTPEFRGLLASSSRPGHKTESVYRRYAIVSDADLRRPPSDFWARFRARRGSGALTREL